MAGTIAQSIKTTVTLDNGEVYTNSTSTKSITQSGNAAHKTTQSVANSYEALSVGDVSTASKYHVQLRNTDASLILYVSFDAGSTDHLNIGPGELAAFSVKASGTVQLKMSAAGPADIEVVVGES